MADPRPDPAQLRQALTLATCAIAFAVVLGVAGLAALGPLAWGLAHGRSLGDSLIGHSTGLLVAGGALTLAAWHGSAASALLVAAEGKPEAPAVTAEALTTLRRVLLLLAALLALGAGTSLRHLAG